MKSLAAAALLTFALAVPMAGTAQATSASPRTDTCFTFFGQLYCSGPPGSNSGQNNNIGRNCVAVANNSTVVGCKTP